MSSRHIGAVCAAALAAALAVGGQATAAPASTAGYVLEYQAAFYQVSSILRGALPGHAGNWHTIQLTFEGDDDLTTGSFTDLTCDAGVVPVPGVYPLPAGCRSERIDAIDFPQNDVAVRWSPDLRHFSLRGPVEVTDGATGATRPGRVSIQVVGTGPLTREVTQDDTYRDVLAERTETSVRGRVLGHSLTARGWVTTSNPLTVYSLYVRRP